MARDILNPNAFRRILLDVRERLLNEQSRFGNRMRGVAVDYLTYTYAVHVSALLQSVTFAREHAPEGVGGEATFLDEVGLDGGKAWV